MASKKATVETYVTGSRPVMEASALQPEPFAPPPEPVDAEPAPPPNCELRAEGAASGGATLDLIVPKGAASVAFTLICSRCEAGAFKLEVTSDGAQGWVSAPTDVACKGTAAIAATLPRQKPGGNETMLEVLARSLLSTRCGAAADGAPPPAMRVWGGLTYALRVTVDPPSIGATTFDQAGQAIGRSDFEAWTEDDGENGFVGMHFRTRAEFEARWADYPEEAARGAEDAAHFMDGSRTFSLLTQETVWDPGPDEDRELDGGSPGTS